MKDNRLRITGLVLVVLALFVLGAAIAIINRVALLFYLAVILAWTGFGCISLSVDSGKDGGGK